MQLTSISRKRYYNLIKEFIFVQFRIGDQQTVLALAGSFLHSLLAMVLLLITYGISGTSLCSTVAVRPAKTVLL